MNRMNRSVCFLVLGFVLMASFASAERAPLSPDVEKEYKSLALEANRLSGAGDFQGAADVLQKLIDYPQLPAFDRAMMGLNKAIMFGKMGKSDEALQAMDQALAIKDSGAESYILENKAILLNNIGRMQESLDTYKKLLVQNDLKPADREKFQNNVNVLEQFFKTQ